MYVFSLWKRDEAAGARGDKPRDSGYPGPYLTTLSIGKIKISAHLQPIPGPPVGKFYLREVC